MTDEDALAKERARKLDALEQKIGHDFVDRTLLELALTHSSLRDPWTESNERLEFLGDSVLGLAVAEHLFVMFPDAAEGEMTRLKSLLVSRDALAKVARALDMKTFLRVGKGIRKRGAIPASLLSNTIEALIGAVYLDAGFEEARAFVLTHFDAQVKALRRRPAERNYKATLQQELQRRFGTTPGYRLLDTVGPDHKKEFIIEAFVGDRIFGSGKGSTKKQAEQRAAREALRELKADDVEAKRGS